MKKLLKNDGFVFIILLIAVVVLHAMSLRKNPVVKENVLNARLK